MRNPDEPLRELERQAALGDRRAHARWLRARVRAGQATDLETALDLLNRGIGLDEAYLVQALATAEYDATEPWEHAWFEYQEKFRRLAEQPSLIQGYEQARLDEELPAMELGPDTNWRQVGPDTNWRQVVTPEDSGAILARVSGDFVEVVHIQPTRYWVGDGEAKEVGYPFWRLDATLEADELTLAVLPGVLPGHDTLWEGHRQHVLITLEGCGLQPEDWNRMDPLHRAGTLIGGGWAEEHPGGWSDDVLPAPADEIEFWSGPGDPEDWEDADESFRVEVLGHEPDEDLPDEFP